MARTNGLGMSMGNWECEVARRLVGVADGPASTLEARTIIINQRQHSNQV